MYKILFIISFASLLSGQSKQDYVWLYSNIEDQSYGYDFNDKKSDNPIHFVDGTPFDFVGNNASICDKDGNLLFYTNGCHVANSDHEIIENGSNLNYGDFIVQFRQDTCEHYPSIQDILLLPSPSSDSNYLVIHKTAEVDKPYLYMSLKYTLIESNLDSSKVVEKNIPIASETDFIFSYLTAVPHSNNNSWWILLPDIDENVHSILLDNLGFITVGTTKIPTNFVENSSAGGTAKFSPDGNQYAFF